MEIRLRIPSSPEAGNWEVRGLPMYLDLKFRPWRYSVSHSKLALRSISREPGDESVELIFRGVLGMKLKAVYESIVLDRASVTRSEEIRAFSGVSDDQARRVQCLTLDGESGSSFVACIRFSIWLHPKGVDSDHLNKDAIGARLILRA